MPAVALVAACVAVPCLFWTRIDAVFAVPKLAALWGVLAFCLLAVAGGALLSGRLPPGARPLLAVDVAVVAFVALNVAAWAVSADRRQSLYGERLQYQGLLTLLLYVGFFAVARLSVSDPRRLRLLAAGVATGAALVAGYTLVQRAGLDPVWGDYVPARGVFSSIGQSNALAAYLVLAIPVAGSLLPGARLASRVMLLPALAAMVAAVLLTGSRGGYLGLLAVGAVLAVAWAVRLGWSARRVVSGLAVAVVAVATTVAAAGPGRDEESVRFHLDAWTVAGHIAADHPLLGTGPDTFPNHFPRYSHALLPPERAAALDAFRVESPHNVYLAIAAGAGFPALAAYLALVSGFVLVVVQAARSATRELAFVLVGVLAATAGHLVTDAFMTAEITGTWLFWVLMGATLATTQATSSVRSSWLSSGSSAS